MVEMSDLSASIQQALVAFEKGDIVGMKNLSNNLIRDAAVTQETETIRLAMISYTLCKIMQKGYYRKDQIRWNGFTTELNDHLRQLIEACESERRDKITPILDHIFDDIRILDESFGKYIEKITNKAIVKKGSTLYSLGLSLGMASQLSGASKWEILHFSGKTKAFEEEGVGVSLEERMKHARKVLS